MDKVGFFKEINMPGWEEVENEMLFASGKTSRDWYTGALVDPTTMGILHHVFFYERFRKKQVNTGIKIDFNAANDPVKEFYKLKERVNKKGYDVNETDYFQLAQICLNHTKICT